MKREQGLGGQSWQFTGTHSPLPSVAVTVHLDHIPSSFISPNRDLPHSSQSSVKSARGLVDRPGGGNEDREGGRGTTDRSQSGMRDGWRSRRSHFVLGGLTLPASVCLWVSAIPDSNPLGYLETQNPARKTRLLLIPTVSWWLVCVTSLTSSSGPQCRWPYIREIMQILASWDSLPDLQFPPAPSLISPLSLTSSSLCKFLGLNRCEMTICGRDQGSRTPSPVANSASPVPPPVPSSLFVPVLNSLKEVVVYRVEINPATHSLAFIFSLLPLSQGV